MTHTHCLVTPTFPAYSPPDQSKPHLRSSWECAAAIRTTQTDTSCSSSQGLLRLWLRCVVLVAAACSPLEGLRPFASFNMCLSYERWDVENFRIINPVCTPVPGRSKDNAWRRPSCLSGLHAAHAQSF